MPKIGFKSLTLPESVFDDIKSDYNSKKEKLQRLGIFSFAGYMTYVYNKYRETI